MSTIEIRKVDRTANVLRAELARMNEAAADASIAAFAYIGHDGYLTAYENAAIEAAVFMRYTYALYVAKGQDPLVSLHGFATRASLLAKPLLMQAYLNIEALLAFE